MRDVREGLIKSTRADVEEIFVRKGRTCVHRYFPLYGVSFIFETHLRHRLVQHPIDCYSFGDTKTVSDFVVAYRKGAYLPQYARDFVEIARQMFEKDE